MSVYFISDLHMTHANMALKRFPEFDNKEHAQDFHDKVIVEKWNNLITKRDKVFILGDLTMEKGDYSFLNELNGSKEIVLGNHDLGKHVKRLLDIESVTKVSGCIKYKGYILTHIPVHTSELDRFKGNIHGHVHENSIRTFKDGNICIDNRYINVSAEKIDFTPILFEEIEKFIS